MKKIGILTYFGDFNNAGTNLQAYATLKAIQNVFKRDIVEILNYQTKHKWKVPYLSSISISSLSNDLKRMKGFNEFLKAHLCLSNEKLICSDYNKAIDFIKEREYDAIFVGSDTLLELSKTDEAITAYWLSPRIGAKKFFLAASARNLLFDDLSDVQKKFIQSSIDDFVLLGIRDMVTYRLLSNFIRKNDSRLQLVPDPTFTLDIDYTLIERYIRKRRIDFNKPTICFHMRRTDEWAFELARQFKRRGFQIASFRPARYTDILLNDLTPFEQLGIYKWFKLVITHRFHDTIFCLKNGTPMITYPYNESLMTTQGESKYYDLLRNFELVETNYIGDIKTLSVDAILNIYTDAIESFHEKKVCINTLLGDYKSKYYKYLHEAQNLLCP